MTATPSPSGSGPPSSSNPAAQTGSTGAQGSNKTPEKQLEDYQLKNASYLKRLKKKEANAWKKLLGKDELNTLATVTEWLARYNADTNKDRVMEITPELFESLASALGIPLVRINDAVSLLNDSLSPAEFNEAFSVKFADYEEKSSRISNTRAKQTLVTILIFTLILKLLDEAFVLRIGKDQPKRGRPAKNAPVDRNEISLAQYLAERYNELVKNMGMDVQFETTDSNGIRNFLFQERFNKLTYSLKDPKELEYLTANIKTLEAHMDAGNFLATNAQGSDPFMFKRTVLIPGILASPESLGFMVRNDYI